MGPGRRDETRRKHRPTPRRSGGYRPRALRGQWHAQANGRDPGGDRPEEQRPRQAALKERQRGEGGTETRRRGGRSATKAGKRSAPGSRLAAPGLQPRPLAPPRLSPHQQRAEGERARPPGGASTRAAHNPPQRLDGSGDTADAPMSSNAIQTSAMFHPLAPAIATKPGRAKCQVGFRTNGGTEAKLSL